MRRGRLPSGIPRGTGLPRCGSPVPLAAADMWIRTSAASQRIRVMRCFKEPGHAGNHEGAYDGAPCVFDWPQDEHDAAERTPPGVAEQPAPVPNEHPAVWDLVVADMQARDREGTRRYGTRLQPFNERDGLVDAYQEALDLAVYLRQLLYERDGR